MANTTLKQLLKEYEAKHIFAMQELQKRKEHLFSQHPELQELENQLHHYSIEISKAIVLSPKDRESLLLKFEKEISSLKKKKEDLLKNLNIAKQDLLPHFECNRCQDTGYISNGTHTEMCSCLKQRLFDIEFNKSNMGNIEKENFSTFNIMKYTDEIQKEKYHSDISPRENIKIIRSIAENFITHFDDPEEKNLLFTGNTGLGKTFLSNCIANELLKKQKTVLYQTAPVMLDNIIDYRFDKPGCLKDLMDNLLHVDLLIIDDLGTETMNSMKFTELFNIINTRLLNQNHQITKTIISTNLSLQNLFSKYDERIVSRLVGYYHLCRFFGDDIRFKSRT